jgi:hypothetical protein
MVPIYQDGFLGSRASRWNLLPTMKTITPTRRPPPQENATVAPVAEEIVLENNAEIAGGWRLRPGVVRTI